jgi:hypothetical protein
LLKFIIFTSQIMCQLSINLVAVLISCLTEYKVENNLIAHVDGEWILENIVCTVVFWCRCRSYV